MYWKQFCHDGNAADSEHVCQALSFRGGQGPENRGTTLNHPTSAKRDKGKNPHTLIIAASKSNAHWRQYNSLSWK